MRRIAASGAVLVVLVVALGTALGGGGSDRPAADPVAAGPVPATRLVDSGPPPKIPLARHDAVTLFLPIVRARATAVLFHAVAGEETLDLVPIGRQENAGLLDSIEQRLSGSDGDGLRYLVDDDQTGAVSVGAAPGTPVYAPAAGEVISIVPNVLDGQRWGDIVSIQPQDSSSVVVRVSHIEAEPGLEVGDRLEVRQGRTTPIGRVVDLAPVLDQQLRHYTQDDGNHVQIEVRASLAGAIP